MSKIKLTLTAEHYDAITSHETDWFDEGSEISLRDYFLLYPLTLEFDMPSKIACIPGNYFSTTNCEANPIQLGSYIQQDTDQTMINWLDDYLKTHSKEELKAKWDAIPDPADYSSQFDDRIKELSIPPQVKYTEADMLESFDAGGYEESYYEHGEVGDTPLDFKELINTINNRTL